MRGVLVDSNVILDIFLENPSWVEWSESMLDDHSTSHPLYINPIIYSEVSIGFERIEDVEKAIRGCGFELIQIPREALFLASKAFLQYKKRRGIQRSPLPDFFVGAHAAVAQLKLITRDTKRIRSYFPTIELISPEVTWESLNRATCFTRTSKMQEKIQKRSVSTEAAPAAVGPYSQGIVCGNLLFVSGQLPIDPDSGELVTGGIEEKTRQVLSNVRAIAEAAGAHLEDVVKTTVFLKDMNDFGAVNTVYAEFFPAPAPARAAIQVGALPKDADIEIEAVVRLPD